MTQAFAPVGADAHEGPAPLTREGVAQTVDAVSRATPSSCRPQRAGHDPCSYRPRPAVSGPTRTPCLLCWSLPRLRRKLRTSGGRGGLGAKRPLPVREAAIPGSRGDRPFGESS